MKDAVGAVAIISILAGVFIFGLRWVLLRQTERREFESAFRSGLENDPLEPDSHEQRWRKQQVDEERRRQEW